MDPSPNNFIRTGNTLRWVDWENSGWGSPAFKLVDLLTQPAYVGTSGGTAAWVTERYAETVEDGSLALRVRAYQVIGVLYWIVRLARLLYEVPRGVTPGRPIRVASMRLTPNGPPTP